MTAVSIECAACSATNVVPASAMLVDLAGEQADDRVAGFATWICTACSDLVAQPVGWPALLSLVAAGAPLVDEGDGPAPQPHPEGPAGGAPFTADDLLDLHQLLDRADWFDEVAAPSPGT